MKCPRCQQDNPSQAKFCLECGVHLSGGAPSDGGPDRQAQLQNDDLRRALAEAAEQQAATAEILKVISSSPSDVQPVFDAIISNAVRLCAAVYGIVWRYEGDVAEFASAHNLLPTELEELRRQFPRRIDTDVDHIHTMVHSGAVVFVRDIEASEHLTPEQRGCWRARGVRSFMMVPMRRDREVIGAIGVSHRGVDAFSASRVELLKTFADQAVIAIENVRLFTELQTSNRELTTALDTQTATSDILRVISRSQTDVQPVFDTVAESAASLCKASDTSIFRLDGDRLRRVAHHGSIPAGVIGEFTVPLVRGSFAGRCVLDGRIVHIADGQTEANEFPEGSEAARRLGFRAILLVPLLREGVAIGAITLRRTEPRLFTERQIALLRTFADQAVIAIENVRLFKELEARNAALTESLDQQTATSEILRVISSSPTDAQPVFDVIIRNAVRLCGGLFGTLFRFDGERLHLVAHHNFTPEALALYGRIYPVPAAHDELLGPIVLEQRVMNVADVLQTVRRPVGQHLFGFRSGLGVPMVHNGVVIGAIAVSRTAVGLFPDVQVELLQTFADQAVIAIENVRLFKELQGSNRDLTRALEQQTSTSEILRVICRAPTSFDPVFDAIATSRRRLCHAATVLH